MKSYKPRISEELARKKLTIQRRFRALQVPVKIDLIHIPHYFFRLRARDQKGQMRTFCASMDALVGTFALVDDSLLEPEELVEPEFKPRLPIEKLKGSLMQEAKWFLKHKARRGRGIYDLVDADSGELAWYPFWIGYHKNKDGSLGFLAIDALSGTYQAGSARRVIIHAFLNLKSAQP